MAGELVHEVCLAIQWLMAPWIIHMADLWDIMDCLASLGFLNYIEVIDSTHITMFFPEQCGWNFMNPQDSVLMQAVLGLCRHFTNVSAGWLDKGS